MSTSSPLQQIGIPGSTQRFFDIIKNNYGDEGVRWLKELPAQIEEACDRWELQISHPYPLSYNYVVAVTRTDGSKAVLKIGAPDPEFQHEIEALKAYNGQGCIRLFEVSADKRAILIENCHPGTQLASHTNDRERTKIIASIYSKLYRPAPPNANLIQLRDWFTNIKKKQAKFNGSIPSCIDPKVNDEANRILDGLFESSSKETLLHGDLHHFNILKQGEDWIAIDPKGVVGPAEYECGPLLLNPYPKLLRNRSVTKTTKDRIAILSEMLGFDPKIIRGWGVCHSVLSAWWDANPITGTGGEYSGTVAKMLSELII